MNNNMDSLQDNRLDFLEYVAALNLVLRGNLEDRLKWSFKVYDRDGNGRLDKQEVKHIIRVRKKFNFRFLYFKKRGGSLEMMKEYNPATC